MALNVNTEGRPVRRAARLTFMLGFKMGLTGKQKAWAEAYLVTLNKTEASRRAGYKADEAGLANIGYQNYRKVEIQEYLQERLKEMTLTADEVLAGLTQEATASISQFLKPDTLELDESKVHEFGHLVKSLTHTKYGPKLELYDGQAAKVHIGKKHGIFSDNLTVKVEGELEKLLDQLQDKLDPDTYNKVVEAIADD